MLTSSSLVFIDFRIGKTIMARLSALWLQSFPTPTLGRVAFCGSVEDLYSFCLISALHFGMFCQCLALSWNSLKFFGLPTEWSSISSLEADRSDGCRDNNLTQLDTLISSTCLIFATSHDFNTYCLMLKFDRNPKTIATTIIPTFAKTSNEYIS